MKSLFCGNYVFSYLQFPEFGTNKELADLHNLHVDPVREYLTSTPREKIQSGTNFTRDALNAFQQLGLFAHSITRSPVHYNGLELDSTSVARILEECASSGYANLAMHLIYSNEVATKSIQQYGNSKQHDKYLARLARGELRAGFGFSELGTGIDASRFSLVAVRTSTSGYVLNGQKCWVSLLTSTSSASSTSSSNSNRTGDDFVLVVVARSVESNGESSLTAFVLDANTPGMSESNVVKRNSFYVKLIIVCWIGVTLKKQPIDGVSLYECEFKNVSLNSGENVLGQVGAGHDITRAVTDTSRFLVGSVCLGLLKSVYKQTVAYVVNTHRFDKSLGEHLAVKNRLASIESCLYTMESIVYFTAGIVDSYQIPDVSCESALVKIFCTDALKTGINLCLDLLGMGAYQKDSFGSVDGGGRGGDSLVHQTSVLVNLLSNMMTNNEVLRLQVATSCVLQAGVEYGDQVIKHRNHLYFPAFIFKQFLANRKLVSFDNLFFLKILKIVNRKKIN